MASDMTAVEPSKTVLDSIWDSVVTPGASSGLIATINAALIVQMLIFGYLLISGWYSIHIIVMIVLSFVMLILFNWFISIVPEPSAASEQPSVKAAEKIQADQASTHAGSELRRRA